MITSQNNGHGAIRCDVSYRIGDLIKSLFNVGWDCKDIANVA
jgi:hypothetical protein